MEYVLQLKEKNELPKEVEIALQDFVEREDNGVDGYKNCHMLYESLNEIGWTCEYYLDAEPYDVRPIGMESLYKDL
jgi:hypothetical protein